MTQPLWASGLLIVSSFFALRQVAPEYFLTGVCVFALISRLVIPFARRQQPKKPAAEPAPQPPATEPPAEHRTSTVGSPPDEQSQPEPPTTAEQHAFSDAAKRYDLPAVRALIEANPAYVNVQPAGRWSALHQFASVGDQEAAVYLLSKGADTAARTRDGETPLQARRIIVALEALHLDLAFHSSLQVARTREIAALLEAAAPAPAASAAAGRLGARVMEMPEAPQSGATAAEC
jgi:hypothetical protein